MTSVHTETARETVARESRPDESEERIAPNGRIAVLVDGLWAGFLLIDQDRGPPQRQMSLFDVTEGSKGLSASYVRDCPSAHKKTISKKIYGERVVQSYRASTTKGEICELFTL
jgi:hypothetical protein